MYQDPVIVVSTQDVSAKLGEMRAKANELKLRASDLEVRKTQLGDQRRRLGADVDHSAIDKQLATVEHELASTRIQLETMDQQIADLTTERDMARAFNLGGPPGPPVPMTAPPADPFLGPREVMNVTIGGFVLLLPFAIVLARRLWVRGTPRQVLDPEDSPRLQRIEQAVESIALEVERIGEAQRFTTKLLAERQSDAAARLGVPVRREPGTITPH
jgi:hypothetical protein